MDFSLGARRRMAAGLALGCCVWLSAVQARAASEADKAAAEALFQQGQTLMDQGQVEEACEKFKGSQQLDAGLGTLLYLADCYEKAKRLASAWATFQEAASVAGSRGDTRRAEIARVRADALQPRLSYAVIIPPEHSPPELEVRRNGTVIPSASLGAEVPIDGGTWKIEASAPGFEPVSVEVTVASDESQRVRIDIPELQPLPEGVSGTDQSVAETVPIDTSPPGEPPVDGRNQRLLAYVVGGVGVAGLLASGVFSLLALSSNSQSKKECDGNDCNLRGTNLRNDAEDYATYATIGGVVGGVGVAVGAAVYLTAPAEERGPRAFSIGYRGQW